MSDLINIDDQRYQLGVAEMDSTHREFIELVNELGKASKEKFISLFDELVKHTEAHFNHENALMQETGFPATRIHADEHLRVLGELNRIAKKVADGSIGLARAYVEQQLPDWFDLHAMTMDSALAAHVNNRTAMPGIAGNKSGFNNPPGL